MLKFDFICISESCITSDISPSDDNLNITDYNMSLADHPSGNQRGGVFIYYKKPLPIKMLNITCLQECICFDLNIGSELCTIVSLYRPPSQSVNEFENVPNKSNLTMKSITQNNLFVTVVIGNFVPGL